MRREHREIHRRLFDERSHTSDYVEDTARPEHIEASGGNVLLNWHKIDEQRRVGLLRDQLERTEADYQAIIQKLKQHDPNFDPNDPARPISYSDMQTLFSTSADMALVQLTVTKNEAAAIVMTADSIDVVDLPNLNRESTIRLVSDWFEHYGSDQDAWQNEIENSLETVRENVVLPLERQLEKVDVSKLVVCPGGLMQMIPFHACRMMDGAYLCDRYEISYAPSLSLLAQCTARKRLPPKNLVAVNYPINLFFTDVEVAKIVRYYENTTILGADSSDLRQAILDHSCDAHVLHYSGHAFHDPANPLDSALVLSDDNSHQNWLSLRDVFCGLHLPDASLCVLSGCETGLVSTDIADEYQTLASGFLYAGAKCVLSSLWCTNDMATALTMAKFYELWQSGIGTGASLREAQRWLRNDIVSGTYLAEKVVTDEFLADLPTEQIRRTCEVTARLLKNKYPNSPPFGSPVLWAPFVAVGATY